MDPVSVILTIASGVLKDVISEMLTNRRKSALKAEIQRQVEVEVRNQLKLEQHQLNECTREIMDQIEILAARSSRLNVTSDRIELTRSRRRKIVPFLQRNQLRSELQDSLDQLNLIVLERRQELGLPLTPEEAERTSEATTVAQDVEDVTPPEANQDTKQQSIPSAEKVENEVSEAAKAIKDMEQRIRERRQEKVKKSD